MRRLRAALLVIIAGVLTFGVVFGVLQAVTRSQPAPVAAIVVATRVPVPTDVQVVARATDSLARGLVAGSVAIGVPSVGSEALLQGLQSGDRLDVLVSLPSPDDSRPVTAVVVRGATVARPATATDPLLLEVSTADALILAHLALGETHLSFVVWARAGSPSVQPPLDERTARAALGLPALAVSTSRPTPLATPIVPTPQPTSAPTATPASDTYTVQVGESFDSIASRLVIDPGALWWVNRADLDPLAPLVAGTRLQLPAVPGFLYQVQPGDTWDSVAVTFGRSTLALRQHNDLPVEADLSPGSLMFIPR
jgi:hypothetical protein